MGVCQGLMSRPLFNVIYGGCSDTYAQFNCKPLDSHFRIDLREHLQRLILFEVKGILLLPPSCVVECLDRQLRI